MKPRVRKCIICGKELTEILPSETPQPLNNSMWNDGIVDIISIGYGSKFDGDQYIIAICDDCIESKLELIGTYM